MSVGLRTRVTEVTMDAVQQVAIRYYARRGELVAKLLTPAGLADPYSLYEQLRAQGPVVKSEKFGAWLVTTYDLSSTAVRDSRLSVDNRLVDGYAPDPDHAFNDHEMLLRMDAPDHTRIRRLVGKAFSPKAIAALRPRIEAIADELLDDARRHGRFDVVGDYGVPLTVRVICEILGVPHDQWRQFREWGDAAARTIGVNLSRADQRLARGAIDDLSQFLIAHIADKRREPGDDLLSAMIAAEEEGERLSDRELVANTFLILLAGFETTVNLIGNGTVALLANRAQWGALVDDPSLLPNAVEELLRYDSPVQFTGRNVPADMDFAGERLTKGKQVMILLASANNDPAVFDDPRRLDITRANAKDHIAFSSGPHYCLGASLARLEGEVAFGALTRTFPELAITATPVRRPTDLLRGYESIPARAATGT